MTGKGSCPKIHIFFQLFLLFLLLVMDDASRYASEFGEPLADQQRRELLGGGPEIRLAPDGSGALTPRSAQRELAAATATTSSSAAAEPAQRRYALITGGTSGVGEAIAFALSQTHSVFIVGRNEAHALAVCETIVRNGGTADWGVGDVGDVDDVVSVLFYEIKQRPAPSCTLNAPPPIPPPRLSILSVLLQGAARRGGLGVLQRQCTQRGRVCSGRGALWQRRSCVYIRFRSAVQNERSRGVSVDPPCRPSYGCKRRRSDCEHQLGRRRVAAPRRRALLRNQACAARDDDVLARRDESRSDGSQSWIDSARCYRYALVDGGRAGRSRGVGQRAAQNACSFSRRRRVHGNR